MSDDDDGIVEVFKPVHPEDWDNRFNWVFFKNYSTSADATPKETRGNCALLSFFQLAKLSRMDYDTFVEGMLSLPFGKYLEKHLRQNRAIVKKAWDRIYNNEAISPGAIGYHGELITKDGKEINLYRAYNVFAKIVLCISIGQALDYDHPDKLDKNLAQESLDAYIDFMSKYTITIPLISVACRIKEFDHFNCEIKSLDRNTGHMICSVYDVRHKLMLCFDSNLPNDIVYLERDIYYPFVLIYSAIGGIGDTCISMPRDIIKHLKQKGLMVIGDGGLSHTDFDLLISANPVGKYRPLVNYTIGYALEQFLYACQPYDIKQVARMFSHYYSGVNGSDNAIAWMNYLADCKEDWVHEMWSNEDGYYASDYGKHYGMGNAIISFIFECINGVSLKDAIDFYREVIIEDKSDEREDKIKAFNQKVKNSLLTYMSNMALYFHTIPMFTIAFNTAYFAQDLLTGHPEFFYCFTSYSLSDQQFKTYYTYVKSTSLDDKHYYPFLILIPYFVTRYGGSVKIKHPNGQRLLPNQVNNQLEPSYSCHFR